jgi:chemotaxis protein methyltransferase CheR
MTSAALASSGAELEELLDAVHRRYHYDFRGHARGTLARGLERARRRLGGIPLAELRDRLLADPAMFAVVLAHLTVPVSELFRDPSFYRAVRAEVVPWLRTFPFVRVWVAGCAGGEEAYSLAVVFEEEGLGDRVLLYATDVQEAALARAAAGVFPLDGMAAASRAYFAAGGRGSLADHYGAACGAARFDARLRRRIVFSQHCLATDQVFAEVQLVTCRNVLIYFQPPLRERALGLFDEALCHGGVLGLGRRETLHGSGLRQRYGELPGGVALWRKGRAVPG